MFLWYKFLHIFFIVSWFAGLFYLPRIYVNLALCQHPDEYQRLLIMAQKLYKFMTPWAIGAVIFGLLMPLMHIGFSGWVHGKILISTLLITYHIYCGKLLRDFVQSRNQRSHKWFRLFNELPVFCLLIALYLALFKPF